MTAREERGIMIAAMCKLNFANGTWIVPSQSASDRTYRVDPKSQTCTCPDHQEHGDESGFKCKHIFAVEIVMRREVASDGTITETKTFTFSERKVYKQNWPAYNLAQSVERERFQELLFDLCQGIEQPERFSRGRKPHTLRDAVFAMALKVYGTLSSRRTSCDFSEAHSLGFTARRIPGMKVNQFFKKAKYTPILKQLIAQSALPLKAVETDFAIDSSGFSGCKFERWYDHKYGVTRHKCVWTKVHIACGVKTGIVTAVRILDKDTPDCPQFIPLVKETGQTFTISEVSADKAYSSLENFEAVAECGGTAFIAFKSNTTGGVGGLFAKMFHYFQFKQEEYLQHYHKRSNVESTFSAIKRKFGDSLRSKDETAMTNESLCKILCHNLCVLNHEQHELGIEPIFWKDHGKADGPRVMVGGSVA